MKQQLVILVMATTALVLIALIVPMGLLVQRFVEEDALSGVGFELQQVETMLARVPDRDAVAAELDALNSEDEDVRATVFFDDGQVIGPDQDVTPQIAEARATGRTVVVETDGGAEFIGAAYGRRDTAVIRLVVAEQRFGRGVAQSWLVLAGLGVALLALSLLVADRLGRFFVGPLVALGETAARLGDGDLDARVDPQGPPDLQQLARTFNQLAGRVSQLVAVQREEAADLAHRLRTPLTAMRLDAEDLPDPEARRRMTSHVDSLTAMVSAIIDEARRPVREGARIGCDAITVVGERSRFWSVLAEDQGRAMTVGLPQGHLMVRSSPQDLAAAVDALLGNVFDHTPEGTGLHVELLAAPGGGARLHVGDDGPGMPDLGVIQRGDSRGGSTGLGLDIVRRTAEASGGQLSIGPSRTGGTLCVVHLGPVDPAGPGEVTSTSRDR